MSEKGVEACKCGLLEPFEGACYWCGLPCGVLVAKQQVPVEDTGGGGGVDEKVPDAPVGE